MYKMMDRNHVGDNYKISADKNYLLNNTLHEESIDNVYDCKRFFLLKSRFLYFYCKIIEIYPKMLIIAFLQTQ